MLTQENEKLRKEMNDSQVEMTLQKQVQFVFYCLKHYHIWYTVISKFNIIRSNT